MSAFDVDEAFRRAAKRLDGAPRARRRRPRSDRGLSRLAPEVQRALRRLVAGQDRPPTAELLAALRQACAQLNTKPPSRSTVYGFLARSRTPERRVGDLPAVVQRALYNLEGDSWVPEAQIAFYCFNYGQLSALSYAAGLPWLALYQARRMRGWRKGSRGLLEAVAAVRKI